MNLRQHLLIVSLCVASVTASGQPPDVVVSDSKGNTAMGTDTLFFTGAGPASGNTGAGYQVLYSNTTGCNNSALGWRALYSNANGCANTAVGASSLIANIDGSDKIPGQQ